MGYDYVLKERVTLSEKMLLSMPPKVEKQCLDIQVYHYDGDDKSYWSSNPRHKGIYFNVSPILVRPDGSTLSRIDTDRRVSGFDICLMNYDRKNLNTCKKFASLIKPLAVKITDVWVKGDDNYVQEIVGLVHDATRILKMSLTKVD